MPSKEKIYALKRGHMRMGAILIMKKYYKKTHFMRASMPSKEGT